MRTAAAIAALLVLELLAAFIGYGVQTPQAPPSTRRPEIPSRRATEARTVPTSFSRSAKLPFPTFPELKIPVVPVRNSNYESLVRDAALQRGISPSLALAVTRVESDFQPREISHKGARGLMQVMPGTGVRFGVQPDELFDPARNVAAGTAYLAWLHKKYRGDLDLTLAAYNAGEGAVDKYGGIPPYPETQEYVRRVRRVLNERDLQ